MNDGVLGQRLRAHQLTTSADDAVIRHLHIARHMAFALENVFLSDFGGLHLTAHLEYVVGADDQNGRLPVGRVDGIAAGVIDDGRVLLDQAILTDDNRAGLGDDGDARMNDAAARYCDVTREYAIVALANNCLWHDLQSGTRNRQTASAIQAISADGKYNLLGHFRGHRDRKNCEKRTRLGQKVSFVWLIAQRWLH